MKPLVQMTLYVQPKTKARPRGAIAGRGSKQYVKFYSDDATAEFEKKVALLCKGHMTARGHAPFTKPVVVFVKFFVHNLQQVDVDNLQKSFFDGGNGVLYKDDCQIQAVYSSKHYDKERPRIEFQMHTEESFLKYHKQLLEEFVVGGLDTFGQH